MRVSTSASNISATWRCARGAFYLLVAVLLAFLLNAYLFGDTIRAVEVTGFGSLGLWVTYPISVVRYYRSAPSELESADEGNLAISRWAFIGVALTFAAIATFSLHSQLVLRHGLWQIVAASLSVASSLLAIEQMRAN